MSISAVNKVVFLNAVPRVKNSVDEVSNNIAHKMGWQMGGLSSAPEEPLEITYSWGLGTSTNNQPMLCCKA
jgi:hypothetical protein